MEINNQIKCKCGHTLLYHRSMDYKDQYFTDCMQLTCECKKYEEN